ncbi:MAG: hypothetical protein ACK4X1_14375 [Terricaulis sp.]
MTFDEAFALADSTLIFVSDGRPPPAGSFGDRRYNLWRSHNFGGEIIARSGEAPFRVLRISDLGNPQYVEYDVSESVAHVFSLES